MAAEQDAKDMKNYMRSWSFRIVVGLQFQQSLRIPRAHYSSSQAVPVWLFKSILFVVKDFCNHRQVDICLQGSVHDTTVEISVTHKIAIYATLGLVQFCSLHHQLLSVRRVFYRWKWVSYISIQSFSALIKLVLPH